MDKRSTNYLSNKVFIYDRVIGVNGEFKKLYDRNRNIRKFLNLLMTREMYMDNPNLGLALHRYVFESNTETVQHAIEADITFKLETYLPVFQILELTLERDLARKEAHITLTVQDMDTDKDYDITITTVKTNTYVTLNKDF